MEHCSFYAGYEFVRPMLLFLMGFFPVFFVTLCPLLLTPCYLMILSARNSTACGIVMPICFAVFKLMMSSNFMGCPTGKSVGLGAVLFRQRAFPRDLRMFERRYQPTPWARIRRCQARFRPDARYAQFVGQMRLPPGDRRCEPRPSCNRPALGPTPRLRRDKREAWFVIAGDFSAKYSVPTKIVPAREVDH